MFYRYHSIYDTMMSWSWTVNTGILPKNYKVYLHGISLYFVTPMDDTKTSLLIVRGRALTRFRMPSQSMNRKCVCNQWTSSKTVSCQLINHWLCLLIYVINMGIVIIINMHAGSEQKNVHYKNWMDAFFFETIMDA